MATPLFNALNNQPINNNGIAQFINEVQNFKKTFTGNPKEEVERLVKTGKMSQEQFNHFANVANQIMAFMPK